MKVLYMGNHNVGVLCLSHLIEIGEDIVGVVVIPEDPNERKYYRSAKEIARKYKLLVFEPQDVNEPSLVNKFSGLKPDIIIVVSYRQILKKNLINVPKKGVINLHGALLPKYRGASPINWAIINGENETGVTIHYIDEGVDTGPIIAQTRIPILFEDTAVTVFDKITKAGFELFKNTYPLFYGGYIETKPNIKEEGSYYRRRKPDQGIINWESSALQIYNLVRALVWPFPGAFTFYNGYKIYVWWAVPDLGKKGKFGKPGEVISLSGLEGICVATGDGLLVLKDIEIEGKEKGDPIELFESININTGRVLESSLQGKNKL